MGRSVKQWVSYHRGLLLSALSLGVLLVVLRLLEVNLLFMYRFRDIYIGAIALVFLLLGVWLARKLSSPKVIVREKELNEELVFRRDEAVVAEYGLSGRELEVLELMAEGLSNQEIAARIFVSVNTVKTHASRLFEKLDVKRRTQAVEKARKTGIIP